MALEERGEKWPQRLNSRPVALTQNTNMYGAPQLASIYTPHSAVRVFVAKSEGHHQAGCSVGYRTWGAVWGTVWGTGEGVQDRGTGREGTVSHMEGWGAVWGTGIRKE